MDVEPTPAHRTAEVESTKTMIDRVEELFDIPVDQPDSLVAAPVVIDHCAVGCPAGQDCKPALCLLNRRNGTPMDF